jgi:hypothetical protein
MDLLFLAQTIDVLGKVLMGITVLRVHWHVVKEHRIDSDVLCAMKKEQFLGIVAILLIITAYLITVFA